MLRQAVYYACCGYGDLFMILPDIEKIGEDICLMLPQHYSLHNIPTLLDILVPNARYRFLPFHKLAILCKKYQWVDLVQSHRNRSRILPRSCLTLQSDRKDILKTEQKDHIIIHPTPSGQEKRYHRWNDLDLSGISFKIVGYSYDKTQLDGEIVGGDFLETAKLILSSRGVLCVDSCVMHLSNILGITNVTIYTDKAGAERTPCLGVSLINPSPSEVLRCVKKMIQLQ